MQTGVADQEPELRSKQSWGGHSVVHREWRRPGNQGRLSLEALGCEGVGRKWRLSVMAREPFLVLFCFILGFESVQK